MKNKIILITILILYSNILSATNPEWIIFTSDSVPYATNFSVRKVLVDNDNYKWVSGFNMVTVYDNNNWSKPLTSKYSGASPFQMYGYDDIVFDYNNSNWIIGGGITRLIPGDDTIEIDNFPAYYTTQAQAYGGYLWVATIDSGLIRYDGTNFVTYNKNNGLFPTNCISLLKIDTMGVFWMDSDTGLIKWDQNNFTFWDFNGVNGKYHRFYSISIDNAGNKWLTFQDDINFQFKIAKFDGTNLTIFDSTSSSVLSNNGLEAQATGIAFDSLGNKWISTDFGLIKYDDSTFTFYDIPSRSYDGKVCVSIAVDKDDNIWLATHDGIAVYNPLGVHYSSSTKKEEDPLNAIKTKFFPNPSERKININYQIDKPGAISCEIYDESGKFISKAFDKTATPGEYNETINTGNLPNGTYLFRMKIGNRIETKQVVISK